jgi:DnaK suppressor protein
MKKKVDISVVDDKSRANETVAASPKTSNNINANQKPVGNGVGADIDPIVLPAEYLPDESEDFMNPVQLLYFRKKLEAWKTELLDDASDTITGLSQENLHQPDHMDRAQIESNAALDLRTRDRERKLLQKIEVALRRIDDGSYGYCIETDEPISLRRLEARPIASLSLHAQERHERMERVHRDD